MIKRLCVLALWVPVLYGGACHSRLERTVCTVRMRGVWHIAHERLARLVDWMRVQHAVTLDLADNNLTCERLSVESFDLLFLHQLPTLRTLVLRNCDLFNVQIPRIQKLAWFLGRGVRKLDISGNYLRFMPAVRLLPFMHGLAQSEIEQLSLADNGINRLDNLCFTILCRELASMNSLKDLDLRRNYLHLLTEHNRDLLAQTLIGYHGGVKVFIDQADDPTGFWRSLGDSRAITLVISEAGEWAP